MQINAEKVSNNINSVIESGLCLFCGACSSICPVNAIEIVGDIYRRPVISDKCINCSKCIKVCPGLTPVVSTDGDQMLGPIKECYIGYSNDSEIRYKASSGGIITSLNLYLLRKKIVDGIICVQQSKNSIYVNVSKVVSKEEDILSALGSRYSPAFVCSALKDLPMDNRKYAIVGKPCDIQAAIKYSEIANKKIFLKIAIFCARTPPMSASREILKVNNINEDYVNRFNYRGNGWPGYFTVISTTDKILLKKRYHEIWDEILCKNNYYNKRCFLCHDCTGELADISVGDAWLKTLIGKSDGHSVIITRNLLGEAIIHDCIKEKVLKLESVDNEVVKDSQKSLLNKKMDIFVKRIIARILKEKIPDEKVHLDLKMNSIRNSLGIIKFFLLKKFEPK